MNMLNLVKNLLLYVLLVACFAWPLGAAGQNSIHSVVTTEQVRAELLAYAPDGIDVGKTLWLGLQLEHQPHWHTYWKNAGESGQPTSLNWSLPSGINAGEIAWPVPKKLPIGSLVNYGYEGQVLLPVPVTITAQFKPDALSSALPVKLKASWLVCQLECIPQEGEFALQLPLHGSTARHASAFAAAFQAQPKALSGSAQVTFAGQQLKLSVAGLPASWHGQSVELFPESAEIIAASAPWRQSWHDSVWTAELALTQFRSASPPTLAFVLVLEKTGQRDGVAVAAPVNAPWPALAQVNALAKPTALPAAPLAANPAASLWLALLGALLGGMILNLMPCVFPILTLKVLGFANHAQSLPMQRRNGLAYSAGVVLSFLALGALLLTLRSAGEQLGWGFQLQSPAVVAALAALFTVLGLNLAGVFEFGQFVPSALVSLQARNPTLNAFFSGLLAVLIASPCTAPFMGASLGLTLSLPNAQALLIFFALGLGMALPYLAASWSPALARRLPRPGRWMQTLRHALAFPLFATVIWLVWVLGQQTSLDGAGALLALLLGLALLLWSLALAGRARWPAVLFSAAILALLTLTIGVQVTRMTEPTTTTSETSVWQLWTPDKVAALRASGQAVFVDFTAAWCVTCQYNKKTTLANTQVLADFAAKKVTLLRADWTRRDAQISAALSQLGRAGVPVYVLYQPGRAPLVLSEIISPAEVHAALASL